MKYLAIIYGNAAKWEAYSRDEHARVVGIHDAWISRLSASGELITAFGLGNEHTAQTVRVRDGVLAVTDGPYLEAKEYVASAYILDVASAERAHELVAELPSAQAEGIELWPILFGDPGGKRDPVAEARRVGGA
jgi:hypothetical protein